MDGIPDPVVAAWDQVEAHWDDPERHEALIAAVASFSCYAWAAGKYKARAGDPIADAQLARLRKAATATMLATATARPARADGVPYRNAMVVLLALVILLGVGAVYAMMRSHGATTTEQH